MTYASKQLTTDGWATLISDPISVFAPKFGIVGHFDTNKKYHWSVGHCLTWNVNCITLKISPVQLVAYHLTHEEIGQFCGGN